MKKNTIIIRPIITEESFTDAKMGVFTFEVSLDATKPEITKNIEKIFNVHVEKVNTAKIRGKKRRAGKKRLEVTSRDSKKAFVRIKAGEKIDLFDVGESK